MLADSFLVWLLDNWHWVVIIGLLLSTSGALYVSVGFLDKEHRFLSSIAQGFSFGIISGIVVGFGFGISEGLPFDLSIFSSYTYIQFYIQQVQTHIIIHFLLGLLIGFIFGFLVGCAFLSILPVYNRKTRLSKTVLLLLITIIMLLVTIAGLEFEAISIVLPIADDPSTAATLVLESTLIFASIALFLDEWVNKGFRKAVSTKKPEYLSWRYFVFWHILANIVVLSLSLFFAWKSGPNNSTSLGELLLLVGFSITTFFGKSHLFIKKPKPRYRAIRDKASTSILFTHFEPLFNQPRFVRGCLSGFVSGFLLCGGMFRIAALFGEGFDLNWIAIEQGLISGCVIGLLFGSLYGFGPALAFKIEQFSEHRLGQIGLVLTVLGIVIAVLPSLLT